MARRMETPPPEFSDIAKTLACPTRCGGAGPANSANSRVAPQRVDHAGAAVVDGIDLKTGRRIVPYEPLINWTRPYPTVDQDVRGTRCRGSHGPEIGAMPGPSSLEAPAIRQWAPPAPPERPADIGIPRADPPHQMVQEARWNSWPLPLKDGQTDTRRAVPTSRPMA